MVLAVDYTNGPRNIIPKKLDKLFDMQKSFLAFICRKARDGVYKLCNVKITRAVYNKHIALYIVNIAHVTHTYT